MSCPGTAGQSIPGRSHERTAPPTPLPLACQPGPPRIVVDDINGRGTLYEIDLTAAPSSAWRVAFFHPPAHLTGPRSKPYVRRLYVHGVASMFTELLSTFGPLRGTSAAGCVGSIDGSPMPIAS